MSKRDLEREIEILELLKTSTYSEIQKSKKIQSTTINRYINRARETIEFWKTHTNVETALNFDVPLDYVIYVKNNLAEIELALKNRSRSKSKKSSQKQSQTQKPKLENPVVAPVAIIEKNDLEKTLSGLNAIGLKLILQKMKELKQFVEIQYNAKKMTRNVQNTLTQTQIIIDELEALV